MHLLDNQYIMWRKTFAHNAQHAEAKFSSSVFASAKKKFNNSTQSRVCAFFE